MYQGFWLATFTSTALETESIPNREIVFGALNMWSNSGVIPRFSGTCHTHNALSSFSCPGKRREAGNGGGEWRAEVWVKHLPCTEKGRGE